MSSVMNFVETPPYSALLQSKHASFETTKVSLRVDEKLLSESTQQPQITAPRLISNRTSAGNHCFVFTACFGTRRESERLAKVTICCESFATNKKLQFDVALGAMSVIENIVSKQGASIVVAVAPAYGESGEGEKREKVWFYTFSVFLSESESGGMETSVIPLATVKLLPALSVAEKPKRPRGRPRGSKRPSSDKAEGSDSGSLTTTTPPASPPKKRARDADTVVVVIAEGTAATDEPSAKKPTMVTAGTVNSVAGFAAVDVIAPEVTYEEILQKYENRVRSKPAEASQSSLGMIRMARFDNSSRSSSSFAPPFQLST